MSMFLEQLSLYAKDQMKQLPPPMYQRTPVRYKIYLDGAGNYKGIADLADEKGKITTFYDTPYRKRSSSIKPKLLVDNSEYTLGIAREESDPHVEDRHRAYITLVNECANANGEPAVVAVTRFLSLPDHAALVLKQKPDLDPSSNVTFQVEGYNLPFTNEKVQEFWAEKASAADETEQTMQCLVCGYQRPPVKRLPIVIQGIPGGISRGLTLISGNGPAFESYGLTESLIAPTCEDCGERFGNALNELLRNENTHILLPPLVYIFWVRRLPDVEYNDGINVPSLMQANSGVIKKLYQSAHRGYNTATLVASPNDFYAATLSASGARVVLRDWIETSVVTVQQHLQRFFWLQRIQLPEREPDYFSLQFLINATMNRKSKEKPVAQVGEALMHIALHGGSLPASLMYRALQRIRATRKVQPEQAALIKMVLLSQQDSSGVNYEKDMTMATHNEEETNVAYLCGRLLAQLDYIQYRALGRVNATIVDRFYGTASTAPAVVFPRLVKGAIPHLAAIRPSAQATPYKGYAASFSFIEKELTQLLKQLSPAFPSTLTLEQQGRFALGFFFQREQYLSPRPDTTNNVDSPETPDTMKNETDTTPAEEE